MIRAKRVILESLSGVERSALLQDIAQIYDTELSLLEDSIKVYEEALEIEAGSRSILQKLLELYTKAESWKKAVETINHFASLAREAK